ncbi:MAG: SRPBCC family protein [Ilumatobacter sp.]|nr:SRPBCC family protein [Ilumatobacter sp.]
MLITNNFEVDHPIDRVWTFFENIPQVAKCLPGTELNEEIGEDHYAGGVVIGLGPVKLSFDGNAKILERNEDTHTIKVDAAGAEKKGRGQAAMLVDAALETTASGTKVAVTMDLQLSGAAAQYGRGLVSDVTAVLLDDFAANAGARLNAIAAGRSPDEVGQLASSSPSGLAIGLRAVRMALARIFRRFFMPYSPEAV